MEMIPKGNRSPPHVFDHIHLVLLHRNLNHSRLLPRKRNRIWDFRSSLHKLSQGVFVSWMNQNFLMKVTIDCLRAKNRQSQVRMLWPSSYQLALKFSSVWFRTLIGHVNREDQFGPCDLNELFFLNFAVGLRSHPGHDHFLGWTIDDFHSWKYSNDCNYLTKLSATDSGHWIVDIPWWHHAIELPRKEWNEILWREVFRTNPNGIKCRWLCGFNSGCFIFNEF